MTSRTRIQCRTVPRRLYPVNSCRIFEHRGGSPGHHVCVCPTEREYSRGCIPLPGAPLYLYIAHGPRTSYVLRSYSLRKGRIPGDCIPLPGAPLYLYFAPGAAPGIVCVCPAIVRRSIPGDCIPLPGAPLYLYFAHRETRTSYAHVLRSSV